MAVIAVWKCDRDGSMFEDKKAADEHDKMLELAECIAQLIEAEVPGISDADAENIGLALAKRKDDLAKACKGKPDVLLPQSSEEDSKVRSING
jgi:dsDNA-binding SOS-regulon protein